MDLAAEVEAELRSLDRRLRAIAEAPMRRERLLQRLEEAAPPHAFALLAGALGRPGEPTPHLLHLREALLDVLREGGASRPFPYELRAALYAEARADDDDFVMRLLRSPAAAEQMEDPAAALDRRVAELPLGVRRSLARGHELPMLEKLLLDPDPMVVEHLMANPRVTEQHVVRIAARRPVAASTLRAIQRSRRFGERPQVRTALCRNPYCPTDLAVLLVGSLATPELREVAHDGTLHPETRSHAAAELDRRTGR